MGFIMFLTLLIAIIALIFAYKAYTRAGGTIKEMRSNIHELGISTEKIRQMTADALCKMEKSVRGAEAQPQEPPQEQPPQPDAAPCGESSSEDKQQ